MDVKRVKLFWEILGYLKKIRRGILKEIDRIKTKTSLNLCLVNSERPSLCFFKTGFISSSLVWGDLV